MILHEKKKLMVTTLLVLGLCCQVDGDPTAFKVAPIFDSSAKLGHPTSARGQPGYPPASMSYYSQLGSSLETDTTNSLLTSEAPSTSFIEIDGTPADFTEINPTSVVKDSTDATESVSEEVVQATSNHEDFKVQNEIDQTEEAKESTNTLKSRFRGFERKSAIDSLKERLKKRYEKSRLHEEAPVSSRRSFAPKSKRNEIPASKEDDSVESQKTRSFRTRVSRPRTRGRASNARSLEVEEDAELIQVEEEKSSREEFGRSSKDFGRRRRPDHRSQSFRTKVRESDYRSGSSKGSSSSRLSAPKLSFKNRGSSRFELNRPDRNESPEDESEHLTSSSNSVTSEPDITPPKVVFKKFDRFDRPDLRKNLFNRFLKSRPGLKRPGEEDEQEEQEQEDIDNIDDYVQDNEEDDFDDELEEDVLTEEQDEDQLYQDHEFSPSALVSSVISDEDLLQQIDNEDIILERLQTTLSVSTVYPDKPKDDILEVATIRSPYTFDIENEEKSTRFITVTRTFTQPGEKVTSDLSTISKTIKPTKSVSSGKKTPLFDTKSIPAPENILTSTSSYNDFKLSGSFTVETLPAVTLQSRLLTTPPFKTVTETFSTKELMIKESILPVIQGSETSQYTLSQTYTVTRYVTAVKTIPPMDFYDFSPSKNFADFDALFEGAGTENRETLLPGELEFSDQDNFGLEGPSPVRVTPPPGFLEDLDLLGGKLDFVETMEKKHNPEILELKQEHPNIQPSFNPFENINPTASAATPSFQLPSISPEQLLYLQLLQNPLAALGLTNPVGSQPQVVTESTPVYRTETVFETNTLTLFQGAKEFTTILTQPLGITTVTDYTYSTKTVSPGGGLTGLTDFNPLANLGIAAASQNPISSNPLGGLLQPSFTVVSSPVIRDTVKTVTETQELKIFFGNVPSLTTITSTSLVSTQVTSFITKTQRVAPTINPLAGLLG